MPLFYINKNLIKVPSKIATTLKRHTPKHILEAIHKDIDVAIELCLIFTTQLTSTYFDVKDIDSDNPEGWKSLKAQYLRELISVNPMAYKHVIEALEYPTAKGQIIECDHERIIGQKNFHYKLGKEYIGKGIVEYEIKTKEALTVLNRHYYRMLSTSNKNVICKNLIHLYGNVTLPAEEQILKEAKRLIKLGYKTKKGKKLTFLNKHSKDYFKDAHSRSFVEDSLEIFHYLTDNGLMIPTPSNERNGGRVIDSLTLMPSWIRNLVKINGKSFIECDFSALHPNIAIALWGGNKRFIIHGDLTNELGIEVDEIKVEHLSFFNKNVWGMKESKLYNYYVEKEPVMIKNIIQEKKTSAFGYKITSRKMFKKEVEIMTEVIEVLNSKGIYVLYVYDALLSLPKDADIVLRVMDDIVLKHGVYTEAKCSSGNKYNPLTAHVKDKRLDKHIIEKITQPKQKTEILIVPVTQINCSLSIKEEILERVGNGEVLEFKDALIKFDDGYAYDDKILEYHDVINPQFKYVAYSRIFGKVA